MIIDKIYNINLNKKIENDRRRASRPRLVQEKAIEVILTAEEIPKPLSR